jgi:hypothetical protein
VYLDYGRSLKFRSDNVRRSTVLKTKHGMRLFENGCCIEGLRYSANNNFYCTSMSARIDCPEVFAIIVYVGELHMKKMFQSYLTF